MCYRHCPPPRAATAAVAADHQRVQQRVHRQEATAAVAVEHQRVHRQEAQQVKRGRRGRN